MRNPFVVKKGIYIDMGCAGIRNVEEGIFIPTGIYFSRRHPSTNSGNSFRKILRPS